MAAVRLVFLLLVVMPTESSSQLVVATSLILLMWYGMTASEGKNGQLFRLMVLGAGAYISLRYITWRGIYTINTTELSLLVMALLLYLAEIYSTTIHLLGCLVNVSPLKRPLLRLTDLPTDTPLPTVDVMVPSYTEPELLEVTLRAALQLNYPGDKLQVHLLDDGGTDQKISSSDPQVANEAKQRRQILQAMCRRLGVNYITRPRNENAKAGNINHALQYTNGELVVVLDADHVPTADFLEYTVSWMVKDKDVFLVQTPHFLINPDPIDRNLLRSFRRMPSENEMFYQTIQRGLDFWSSSFFCGSAALLRRSHLKEVGGVSGDSITEDAETAFQLHNKGYRSVYVNRPMVAGLAPETFSDFITQRMRWAQGMIQIMLLKRPFMASGLKWYQRMGYMSTILFWLFPFARTIFLLAPLAYLIFGAHIYDASLMEVLAYTLPHLIATYMVASMLFGRTRWPLVSELYELLQSIFSMVAIVKVIINPRKPSFLVTPKGNTLDRDFISPLFKPFYLLFVLMIMGYIIGIERYIDNPATRDMTVVVMLWNTYNFITVLAAMGVLLERRQKRTAPRMPISEPGFLISDDQQLQCEITDLSSQGCHMLCQQPFNLALEQPVEIRSFAPALDRTVTLPARIRTIEPHGSGNELGVQFVPQNERQSNEAVAFAFGDTRRWEFFQMRRTRPIHFGNALGLVMSLIWYPALIHIRFIYQHTKNRFVQSRRKENINA